jgi:transcriptional regulator with XRE-family HTH domain
VDGLSELGALVRRLRVEAGMSGAELARRSGVPQPSVSRLEAGRRLADGGVAGRLAGALGLSDEEAGQIVVLARDAYAIPPGRRARVRVSVATGQFRRRLLASREVRSFSCATIPAPLQTAEYAHAAAGHEPAEDWTRLAEDESRSLTFVVTEGALRTWPGQVSMTDQLARVQAVSRRASVRVGVLPWTMPLPRMPLCDFMIAGDPAVCVRVQTFTAGFTLARPEDVAAYAAVFEALAAVAVYGEQADAVIADITAGFAKLTASYSR